MKTPTANAKKKRTVDGALPTKESGLLSSVDELEARPLLVPVEAVVVGDPVTVVVLTSIL